MKISVKGHLRKQDGYYHAVVEISTGNGKPKQKSQSTELLVSGNNKRKAEAILKEFMAQIEKEVPENPENRELFKFRPTRLKSCIAIYIHFSSAASILN